MLRLDHNGAYWRARGTDPTGREVSFGLGNRAKVTRAEAKKAMAVIERRLIAEGAVVRDPPWLKAWCEAVPDRRPSLAKSTKALFESTAGHLLACLGDVRMDRVTRAQAESFRKHLAGAEGIASEDTIRNHLRRAKTVFEEARRQDRIPYNPFDRIKCAPLKRAPRFTYVTPADAQKVIEACPDSGWRCLFALCRFAGLRRGEAFRLTWGDVDLHRGLLHVRAPGGVETSKHRDRITPIEPGLARLLADEHAAALEGSPGPCSSVPFHNLHRNAEAIIRRGGVVPWSDPFHTLRKCLVSDWQAKYPPLDVARWLGHSVTVAANNYHETLPDTLAKVTGGETELERLRRENEEMKRRLDALLDANQ